MFSFQYDPTFLTTASAHRFDPDPHLVTGSQYVRDEKLNFGLFLDSSPDRWGRLLMRRREAVLARQEERREMALSETDYLLGVYDELRMGAIRFKINEKGPLQNDNRAMAAPPFTALRELEQASLRLEAPNATDSPQYAGWLTMLLAPGSSLGGRGQKRACATRRGSSG